MRELLVSLLLLSPIIFAIGAIIYVFWKQSQETKEYIKWLIKLEELEKGEM